MKRGRRSCPIKLLLRLTQLLFPVFRPRFTLGSKKNQEGLGAAPTSCCCLIKKKGVRAQGHPLTFHLLRHFAAVVLHFNSDNWHFATVWIPVCLTMPGFDRFMHPAPTAGLSPCCIGNPVAPTPATSFLLLG